MGVYYFGNKSNKNGGCPTAYVGVFALPLGIVQTRLICMVEK